jgi:Ankyrin repeats (3 copies)
MSEALPLRPRPNLDQYRKLAKELRRVRNSGQADAIREWAAGWAQRAGLDARETERAASQFQSGGPCTLTQAQCFVARAHGFASWPRFAGHVAALARADSGASRFEAAVDAIISGDGAALRKFLAEQPDLVRARSPREHRSTLLHYVSANGVEDFRQETPKNIVEIATMLLEAGADVNAVSDAYGGGSTTLALTATSVHPERAGVQIPLLELLLAHGAAIGNGTVNACLHNGRGEAAESLASRGAPLDLEAAAGVGRIELVESLWPAATPKQIADGFAWACEFGRTRVVEFLLERGMTAGAKLGPGGQTGLHWAAYGGHAEIVKLLLARGAPADATEDRYGGTPLDWGLHGWIHGSPRPSDADDYETVALLARAGATYSPWSEETDEGRRASAKLRADARMQAALQGVAP